MSGKLYVAANGHWSFDIEGASQNAIFEFATVLNNKCGLDFTKTVPVPGLDGVYWDRWKGDIRLTVGWDIWSGAFVFAHCSDGDDT